MNDKLDVLELLKANMQSFSADALIDAILMLSRDERLPAGTRLPTISEVANQLTLSTSTVSRAWSNLLQVGVIETKRRGGTFIALPVEATAYRSKAAGSGSFKYQLASGYPDPNMQIDLSGLLKIVSEKGRFVGYQNKDLISTGLREKLLERINYSPDRMMLDTDVIGVLPDILQALSHRGAQIGMADPEFPLYLSIIKKCGLSPIPIPFSVHGYSLQAVERALKNGVRVILVQTRVHSPTGLAVPTKNLKEIAELLKKYKASAIEIDHHGSLLPEFDQRLASFAPANVVLISSFSKDLHPDIRVSLISGSAPVLERIQVRRSGGGWVSGVNKQLLEVALSDSSVHLSVAKARRVYDLRREAFKSAFAEHGVQILSNAGLYMWIPVISEQEALVHLAAKGISVARGSAFQLEKTANEHIFLSLGPIGENTNYVVESVVKAALSVPNDLGYISSV